jgi:hypothetical protein
VRRNVALALAHDLNAPLLDVSVPALLAMKDNVDGNLALLLREAQFQNAIAYLDGFDGRGSGFCFPHARPASRCSHPFRSRSLGTARP